MKRLTLALWLVLTASALGQVIPPVPSPVSIDGPERAAIGDLVILSAAGEATDYSWLVIPETPHFEPAKDGTRAFFSSGQPGTTHFVLAIATEDGKVFQVRHSVTVGEGDDDENPPPPPPQPVVVAGQRFIIVVRETAAPKTVEAIAQKARQAALLADAGLRKQLADKGHTFHPIDQHAEAEWLPRYLTLIAKTELALPYLFIVDDSGTSSAGEILYTGPLPETVEAVIELVEKWGG